MTLADFRGSLSHTTPPSGLAPALVALWHAGRDDWDEAHRVAQDIDDASGAWVHAHLHRVEGDLGNAAYWYRRARQPVATGSLPDEWALMVEALLEA